MNFITLSNQYILGFSLLVALIVGFLILRSRARTLNLNLRLFEEWIPWLTVSSLVLSRITALAVLDWRDLIQTQWWQVLYFWDGNLSLWGAVIGFFITLAILCRRYDQSFGKWADALVRPLLAMIIIGRLGNFLDAGTYYGRPTEGFPGIVVDNLFFPLSGIRHHPIAIYEAIFIAIALAGESIWRRNLVPGVRFCAFLIVYATWRILLEFIRFDAIEIYENITWDQGLSFLILVAAIAALIIQHFRVRHPKQVETNGTEG